MIGLLKENGVVSRHQTTGWGRSANRMAKVHWDNIVSTHDGGTVPGFLWNLPCIT